MARQHTGWISYGSDDPDVVFRHSLTTPITASDISGKWNSLIISGNSAGPTHDSVRGMKPVTAGGANSGYEFNTAIGALTGLDSGGQVSLEVERDWVCWNSSANGSSGYTRSATECVLSSLRASGTAIQFFQALTTSALHASFLGVTTYQGDMTDWTPVVSNITGLVHSNGKPDYITLRLGWWGGRNGGVCLFCVDDLPMGGGTTISTTASGYLHRLFIGSNQGLTNFAPNHYIRNLQICRRPPVMPIHPALRSVAVLSDSLVDDLTLADSYRDISFKFALRRFFAKHNFRPGALNISENGGYSVTTVNTQLETKVATVLAWQPDVVVISGGTNDLGSSSYVGADFDTEAHDLLEQLFLGVAKTARNTVQKVFWCTPPPRRECVTDTAMAARHVDVRTRIAALPAWWDATYGATYGTGRVRVIDRFGAFGGDHTVMSNAAISGDGIHLAWEGNRLHGEMVAKALHYALGS
jgi:lysophospholipase L1-like esterase